MLDVPTLSSSIYLSIAAANLNNNLYVMAVQQYIFVEK